MSHYILSSFTVVYSGQAGSIPIIPSSSEVEVALFTFLYTLIFKKIFLKVQGRLLHHTDRLAKGLGPSEIKFWVISPSKIPPLTEIKEI